MPDYDNSKNGGKPPEDDFDQDDEAAYRKALKGR